MVTKPYKGIINEWRKYSKQLCIFINTIVYNDMWLSDDIELLKKFTHIAGTSKHSDCQKCVMQFEKRPSTN